MIVVSNTSPIMNLAAVGQLGLLEQLHGKVLIPSAVWAELTFIYSIHSFPFTFRWPNIPCIETRVVENRALVDSLLMELHDGEAETLALAVELKADLVLMDERIGRRVASRLGLKGIGLLGLLIEAKHKGFIKKVKPILDELIVTAGFWIDKRLYARILAEMGEEN